jgi:hypothetical protein
MTASSPDIPQNNKRACSKGLLDYPALYPGEFSHLGVRVSALGARLVALVERVVSAPSAAYMGLFAGEIAHRGCAFRHPFSPTLEGAK